MLQSERKDLFISYLQNGEVISEGDSQTEKIFYAGIEAAEKSFMETKLAQRLEQSVCESDRRRLDWCIATISDLIYPNENMVSYDWRKRVIMVRSALRTVLEPSLVG